ncbi:DUF2384 domain-containing protein [Aestuariicella sp. G3-2]|uniref:antitoxin Xre/MbcA/ParS toxin-binding domain-containing protein n=1 Tax=Pseudomaricurvus albidus TaxID=2842452 RepID=UPI001C0B44F3|nr:antitoxin Xre/MbcA/ParS toxin-binding domain-containing protein [Aestuariicella albida]MBU3068258.1 DUF2384 domain-containing protein [Aestuariicella albida]
MLNVSHLAGVPLKSPLDEILLVQSGLQPEALDALKDFGISPIETNWIINSRTLTRRKQRQQHLTPYETERWLRAAKILSLALEVFGNKQKASSWLHKPRKLFENQSAMEILHIEAGAQLVEMTLNQIDAGFIS